MQKYQKGFIAPALAIIGVLILGGVVYYYSKHPVGAPTSTPASVISSVNEETSASVTLKSGNGTTQGGAVSPTPTNPSAETVQTSSNSGGSLVEVTTAGTLAQRFNLETLTDTDYSYAISFPRQWTSSGASSLVTVTNGRSSVVIASQAVEPGTTPEAFASQSGAASGFITTKVNAYSALETISGNQDTYFIVNGSVGYKIVVTDLGDTGVLQTMLLTFTVTKQR